MDVLIFLVVALVRFVRAADDPVPVAVPAEPTAAAAPADVVGPAVNVDVFADPAVSRARAKLFQDLKDQGYRKGDHKNDRTIFKSYTPYHPRVVVHDDGWVYLQREPPRFHSPGKSFADQGSPANYLLCVLAPTACISLGGWMIGDRKYQALEGDILDAIHGDVNALNEAVARKALELRVNTDIPADCEKIWGEALPADARRRLLFTFWETRLDSPEGDIARKAIMAFIKGEVMQSDLPFTEDEITTMNTQRHCQMVFDPRLAP
jgi:hypothetical protein